MLVGRSQKQPPATRTHSKHALAVAKHGTLHRIPEPSPVGLATELRDGRRVAPVIGEPLVVVRSCCVKLIHP